MRALSVFIPAIVLCHVTITVNAQELQLGFNGNVALPQYQFDDNINSPGGGLNISAVYGFAASPFGLGLDFSFIHFGTESQSITNGSTSKENRFQIDNDLHINQAMMLFTARQQQGMLQAYLEGLAGFNFFFSETSVKGHSLLSSGAANSQLKSKNIAFAWGGGAGVMIRLFDTRKHDSWIRQRDNLGASFINIGFRYLHGSEAEYLKNELIQIENQDFLINGQRSRADMLMIQLGFVFQFQ